MFKLMLSLFLVISAVRADDGVSPPTPTAPATPVAPATPAAPVTPVAPALTMSGKNAWRASLAAMAVADVLDAQSSWGKRELNTNLAGTEGTFGAKGALIKFGILGGVAGLEYLILHHGPSKTLYRTFALINFGGASATSAVAAHNYTVPHP